MIQSKFILDILYLLLDGAPEVIALRSHIPNLTDDEYEYTGGGVFISFSYNEKVVPYQGDKPNLRIGGVLITTREYPIEADADLVIRDGLIDYLEIWCYLGDYPQKGLTKYTLRQAWQGSPGKSISNE